MQRLPRLALALVGIIGLHGTARAAAYDFSFLSMGISVGQGSFSLPDADLGQPYVDVGKFTSFQFKTAGLTFTSKDLLSGAFVPRTTSFRFDQVTPSGAGFFLNQFLYPTSSQGFMVTGFYYEPCYVRGVCGPADPAVFQSGSIRTYDAAGVLSTSSFDTISITSAAIPEPATAALLGSALLGVTMLTRRRRPPSV